jgi:DNA-binding IclR family transcriptional regulator
MKKISSKPAAAGRGPTHGESQDQTPWTFLTNHAHVLWCIYRQPEIRLREIAELVGITERMVQKIVAELAAAGYVAIRKDGRRNVYELTVDRPLRHSLESHCSVGQLLDLLGRTQPGGPRRAGR